MNEETKKTLDYIIKLSTVTELKGSFVISKRDNMFVGIDVRFDPPLNLKHFPSITHAMEVLKK
jgi:hypothetical protein